MDIITKFLNGPWMKKAMKLSVDLLHNKKLNETLNKVVAYIKYCRDETNTYIHKASQNFIKAGEYLPEYLPERE